MQRCTSIRTRPRRWRGRSSPMPRNRIASAQPLDSVAPAEELDRRAGATVTEEGIGWDEALRLWAEVLAPATISTDHPAFLAFVPGAPTKASVLFDLVVGASSTIAAGWIEGAGAIWAENQALAVARRPRRAAARRRRRLRLGWLRREPVGVGDSAPRRGGARGSCRARWRFAACETVHSSVAAAARVMDVGVLDVRGDERGRLTGPRFARRSMPTVATVCSPWSRAPAPRTPAPSTTSRVSPRCARSVVCGSTSMAPTAARVCWHRASASAVRRRGARRLVHRGSAQMVVRALRRVRAAVP